MTMNIGWGLLILGGVFFIISIVAGIGAIYLCLKYINKLNKETKINKENKQK